MSVQKRQSIIRLLDHTKQMNERDDTTDMPFKDIIIIGESRGLDPPSLSFHSFVLSMNECHFFLLIHLSKK
jgi:hypothetical protein